MRTKVCFKCGRELPIDEFYRHKKMSDGYMGKCKDCTKQDRKDYVEKHPDRLLKTRLSICEKDPTHNNAYKAIEAAVASGVIEKPTVCSICGCSNDERRIEAHHYDYSKPLDVIWICSDCHDKVDRLRRKRLGLPEHSGMRPIVMIDGDRVICRFDSTADAARSTGLVPHCITACLKGRSKTSGGYKWRYADDVEADNQT